MDPCDAVGGTWVGIQKHTHTWVGISRIRYDEAELLTPSISAIRLGGGFMHAMNAKDSRHLYDGASSTLGPAENWSDPGYSSSRGDKKMDILCSDPRIPDHLCDKRAFWVVYAVRREHILT